MSNAEFDKAKKRIGPSSIKDQEKPRRAAKAAVQASKSSESKAKTKTGSPIARYAKKDAVSGVMQKNLPKPTKPNRRK